MKVLRMLALIPFLIVAPWLSAEELSVYQLWNRALMDDPVRAVEAIQKRMQNLDKTQDAAEWLQLVLVLSHNANMIEPKAKPTREEILEAQNEATARGLDEARLLLQNQIAQERNVDAVTADFQSWLQEARRKGLHRTEALLLNSRGFALFYLGRYAESLQAGRDALRAMQRVSGVDDADLLSLKNDLASDLDYLGDSKQSRALYKEILAAMEGKGYRYIRAVVSYNFAAMLRDEKDWALGRTLYQQAIDLTASIQETVIHALAKKGLAEILIKEGRLAEAKPLIQQTIAALQAMDVLPDAIADAWRLWAKVQVLEKNWPEAREALQKAQIDQLAGVRNYQSDLSLLRSSTLEGTGHLGEALQEARRSATLLQEQMRADRQGEIAKLSAQLGLELLTKENEIQAQKIRESAILKQAFALVSLLTVLALFLLRQVTRSRLHMKQILDHIEEGLITINGELKCSSDFSPYMEHLLGIRHALLKDLDVLGLLLDRSHLTSDQKSVIRNVLLASLGEDPLAWDLNQSHLPQELMLDKGEKFLALHWQMLKGRSGHVRKILLAIRDITERKQSQRRAEQIEVLSQELWQTNISQAAGFLQTLRAQTDHPGDARLLHTWKGNARTLGLASLANAIHQVESDPKEWNHLRAWIDAYQSLLGRLVSLSRPQTGSLWQLMDESSRDLQRLIEEHQLRPGTIHCEDHFQAWDETQLQTLRLFLIHGISNAVDHGFVRPRARGQTIAETVDLHIRAFVDQGSLHLELEDNGAGLDQARLSKLDRPLFEEGVTTSENLSSTSGRGLGLAAIRQAVQALGGRCQIQSKSPQGGTRLSVCWPLARSLQSSGF